ncbi:mersacidin/lichenicidin family type 2 lantibiotic [Streptomyces longispororuber]|uniref:mersacidin/lichenicidin family type 2 lantibiotic n=1 Tax=Streptomyces longispororuber TaxID=68230 RepID=UPI00210A4F9A|nr:mersacidin/lichenicidin family type 2 lantibiotic [Streptomyces longispororuber]MCQ4208731.1 mersacidin/lichenicidin family type 2 lantibiotic [Streptomyces longispororuber]
MDTVKAWKDPEYRAALSGADREAIPANPAGIVGMSRTQLSQVAGGTSWWCAGVTLSVAACDGTKGYSSLGCC